MKYIFIMRRQNKIFNIHIEWNIFRIVNYLAEIFRAWNITFVWGKTVFVIQMAKTNSNWKAKKLPLTGIFHDDVFRIGFSVKNRMIFVPKEKKRWKLIAWTVFNFSTCPHTYEQIHEFEEIKRACEREREAREREREKNDTKMEK